MIILIRDVIRIEIIENEFGGNPGMFDQNLSLHLLVVLDHFVQTLLGHLLVLQFHRFVVLEVFLV
jgi:hypothetical protein